MPEKIKVLLIIATFDAGGAQQQITELAVRLKDTEFEPVVICLARGGALEKKLASAGVRCLVLGKKHKLDISTLFRLVKIFRRERPSVIHSYMFTSNLWARLTAFFVKVRAVIISERAADHWKGPLHWVIDRLLFNKTDLLIAVSKGVEAYYRDIEGIPASSIKVIYNGCRFKDTPPGSREEARKAAGLPAEGLLIGHFGRLVPFKNQSVTLEAFALFLKSYPGSNLVLAGDGPMEQTLRKRAAELNLTGRVIFSGNVCNIEDHYRSLDMFVFPTINEGLPNALLEAAVFGVPVIASDTEGNNEVVLDGETGLLLKNISPLELSSRMKELAGNAALRAKLALGAKERVRKVFDMEKNTGEIISEYRRLIGKPRSII